MLIIFEFLFALLWGFFLVACWLLGMALRAAGYLFAYSSRALTKPAGIVSAG